MGQPVRRDRDAAAQDLSRRLHADRLREIDARLGFDLANVPPTLAPRGGIFDIRYDGTEGELYNLREDPMQWRNLWNDPAYAKLKSDLRADLYDNLPPERNPKLPVEAPA